MKIVSGRVMAEIDRTAIEERGIPSLALMERAGWSVAREFHRLCRNPSTPVVILCGRGNNGGDGWVAARHLQGWGYRPRVIVTHPPESLSPDSRANWERYRGTPFACWEVWEGASSKGAKWFSDSPVVIDSLLGTGATGAPKEPYSELIRFSEERAKWTLGVDIPSGVEADTGDSPGESVTCRSTVTFGLPKKGHFLGAGLDRTGALAVADIGFPKDLLQNAESEAELIAPAWAAKTLPRYPRSTHKGVRGKTLILAGSPGLLGAAILAARACLAAGSGLVTLGIPASLNAPVKAAVPEAMTLPLPETSDGSIARAALARILEHSSGADAVAIGPGLGSHPETQEVVVECLAKCDRPMALDADGLNALAARGAQAVLRERRGPTVLTPHPGEVARMLGVDKRAVVEDPRVHVERASEQANAIVVLKGPTSFICSGDGHLYLNHYPNDGMATAGSGDVLAGMIGGIVGQQKIDPKDAVCLAVYVHSLAGDLASRRLGHRAMTAVDIISHLGDSFLELRKWRERLDPVLV
ncbi:MAG: NAD(P)H-hydrate dehydratase [Bdellovibrionales bacterium]|nr:NAD(P)H-hydrate dehydratase [Bdellovibrionales bacterium]